MIYLTSPNESDFIALNSGMCVNLGIPNDKGTTRAFDWQKAINEDLWFGLKMITWPGNRNEQFTEQQIYSGLSLASFIEKERNDNWFPPVNLGV